MAQSKFPFQTPYGRFSDHGTSYMISRPDTPRPWMNLMSSGSYGIVLGQSGSGYSGFHPCPFQRLTRGGGDWVRDDRGRYLYLRDEESGKFWSVSWQPVQAKPTSYEVIQGVGYTIFQSENEGIQAQWLVFVPSDESLEVWRLRLKNAGRRPRKLTLWSCLEWEGGSSSGSGASQTPALATSLHDKNKILLVSPRAFPSSSSTPSPLRVAWHAVSLPVKAVSFDLRAFLGAYGSLRNPGALQWGAYRPSVSGQPEDVIASFCVPLSLKAREERSLLISLGAADSQAQALAKARQFMDFSQVDSAWGKMELSWENSLGSFPVKTPDPAFDCLTNTWLKSQVLSGWRWGRETRGRDVGVRGGGGKLQDSQIFLPWEAEVTREEIHRQASRQLPDGSVPSGRHGGGQETPSARFSEDLLWLPFVVLNYLKEMGRWELLNESVPFAHSSEGRGEAEASLREHFVRAIDHTLKGFFLNQAGESVARAHFLCGVLREAAEMLDRAVAARAIPSREKQRAVRYRYRAEEIKDSLNRLAWDGAWYREAVAENGQAVGSAKSKEGKIYLNAQVWAILAETVSSESRRRSLVTALDRHLQTPQGPLFLWPAYTVADERIGEVTRSVPGTGDNGGVEVRSAVWALQMECQLGRAKKAWSLYQKLSPLLRNAADPEQYQGEPYRLASGIDGPAAFVPGRAGRSWATGPAAWLYRVSTEWILGIRPTWEGLLIRPCLPPPWKEASATRVFRGGIYQITFVRDSKLSPGSQSLVLNDQKMEGDVLPVLPATTNRVRVMVGPARDQ